MPPDASRSPELPPAPPDTSSPRTMTRSSRAISWCSAWLSASRIESCDMRFSVLNVDVGIEVRLDRRRRGSRLAHRAIDELGRLRIDCVKVVAGHRAIGLDSCAKALQAIHRLAMTRHLVFRPIILRVALEVTIEARDGSLERGRTLAAMGARD